MPPAIHYSLSTIHRPAARHYHPTLSLWLSVDPMADKYPGVSPYAYCGNNPVRLVDPNGEFPIKIHQALVNSAFSNSQLNGWARYLLYIGSGVTADIANMFNSNVHLDNMKGTYAIKKAYNDAIWQFSQYMDIGEYELAGVELHTICDFYAHSNYIDLYHKYAKINNLSTNIKDIPTFSDAMKNPKLMEFISSEGGLKTGSYSLLHHFSSDPESHNMMNLDSPTSHMGSKKYNNSNTYYDAAINVAQRELKKLADEY